MNLSVCGAASCADARWAATAANQRRPAARHVTTPAPTLWRMFAFSDRPYRRVPALRLFAVTTGKL